MSVSILQSLEQAKTHRQKKFVVLIDPDKVRLGNLNKVLDYSLEFGIDYFFVGGSLIVNNMLEQCLISIRESCSIPVILFPGNSFQLSSNADAILFLSLISGRNPELLIGNHVVAAPYLKTSPLEVLPTGYMLIDGGASTSVLYMSNTQAIPADKADIAVCTAMAGEMLGLRLIYMDAGSGAPNSIRAGMISDVSHAVSIPLIVGGGIKTPEIALSSIKAGADVIVVGNAIEKEPALVREIADAVHSMNKAPASVFLK
jgi:putative glycerol-1-phosphate prenyltransferase